MTDLKCAAVFPTDHPLHVGAPSTFLAQEAAQAIAAADVILSLDWVDLAGALKAACGTVSPAAKVIAVTLDHQLHNGWSMDHQALPPADLFIAADADTVVAAMLAQLPRQAAARTEPRQPPADAAGRARRDQRGADDPGAAPGGRSAAGIAAARVGVVECRVVAVAAIRSTTSAAPAAPGSAAGRGSPSARRWRLRGSGRLPVAVCGDGDFLMGATALWTAVHYNIPLLVVVANNRSFFNDELHQERVARMRNRPVENRWIGQRIADPEIDLAQLARAQGALGFGPVTDGADLAATFREAIEAVAGGAVAVVDVRVAPGYAPAAVAGLFRT